MKASKFGTQDHIQIKGFPNKGAYDDHDKLYIGKYPFHKWVYESFKPPWDEIRTAQYQVKDKDGLHKKYQDNKREQA